MYVYLLDITELSTTSEEIIHRQVQHINENVKSYQWKGDKHEWSNVSQKVCRQQLYCDLMCMISLKNVSQNNYDKMKVNQTFHLSKEYLHFHCFFLHLIIEKHALLLLFLTYV